MAGEDQPLARPTVHVDQLADQAAELGRQLAAWDVEQAEKVRHRVEPTDDQLADRAERRNEFERKFASLLPFIRNRVRNYVRRQGGLAEDAEDLAQVVALNVFRKLHKYDPRKKSPLGPTAGGAQFGAWLATEIKYRWRDRFKKPDLNTLPLPIDEKWLAQGASESVARQDLPDCFTATEEQAIGAERAELRNLLLYAAGLWPLVSAENQRSWSDYPTPSAWECLELTAKERAGNYARRLADQQLRQAQQDSQPEHQLGEAATADARAEPPSPGDQQRQEMLLRCSQRVAHNLKRRYWTLFELETAWQHLLRYVPSIGSEPLDAMDEQVDRQGLVSWLYFDLWLAIDRASRWKQWLLVAGIKNTGAANMVRVAALPWGHTDRRTSAATSTADESSGHQNEEQAESPEDATDAEKSLFEPLNQAKLSEVGRMLYGDTPDSQREGLVVAALLDGREEWEKMGRARLHEVRRLRYRIDLPVPYALADERSPEDD